ARYGAAAPSAAPAEPTAAAAAGHCRQRAAGIAFEALQLHLSQSDIGPSAIRDDDRERRLLSRHDHAIVGQRLDPEAGRRRERVLEFAFLLPQPEIELVAGRIVEV